MDAALCADNQITNLFLIQLKFKNFNSKNHNLDVI